MPVAPFRFNLSVIGNLMILDQWLIHNGSAIRFHVYPLGMSLFTLIHKLKQFLHVMIIWLF